MSGTNTVTATASRLPQSFTRKKINVTFTIYGDALGPDGAAYDQVKLEGYRCQVDVINASSRCASSLTLSVYGLPTALMNRLSILPGRSDQNASAQVSLGNNSVLVEAGDDRTGMSSVFFGFIGEAFADFSTMPNVAFRVIAYTGLLYQAQAITSTSFSGPVNAATILSQIAAKSGLQFTNYGVSKMLPKWYSWGTAVDQVEKVRQAIHCIATIDGGSSPDASTGTLPTLKVWSGNLAENAPGIIPKVSAKTGLIGYPSYSQQGVIFTSEFDPRIAFYQPLDLVSNYLPAAWQNNQNGQLAPMPVNGRWVPVNVSHALDSELPNGRWFTIVEAQRGDLVGTMRAS